MEKKKYNIASLIFFSVFFLVFLLSVIWASLEDESQPRRYQYGLFITFENIEAAEIYGVKEQGRYVVNKEGNLVPLVRGGLKMVVRGIICIDGPQISLGFEALLKGVK